MTQEDALNIIARALAPESLTPLQINIFIRAWNKQSYVKIAQELNHQYTYITDVGSELWKLLSQKLKIKVTKVKLQNALERYVQQEQIRNQSALSPLNHRVDWGEAPDTSQFYGRQEQLNKLEQWVIQDNCRAIAITGMGGIGKTMLVTRLTQQLVDKGMFDIVVWRSLKQAPPFADFIAELGSAIAQGRSPSLGSDAPIRLLLEHLRHHRCLLILDNVEAVMQDSELVGTYRPGYEDYGWLFQQLGAGRHQSTILLTSREIPAEVAILQGVTSQIRLLRLKSLSSEGGKKILATKGLTFQAEQPQVKELIQQYRGNPLALEIVATPIKELFDSNISAFLAQEALLFTELRGLIAQQFNRLSSLEKQVMYWLAINREPVTAAQLQADIMPSVSQVELRDALVSLDRRSLIEKIKLAAVKPPTGMKSDYVSYTQQPVVMEYATEQLIEGICQEDSRSQIVYLKSYALLKAQAKDYVRNVQIRLIVQPILTRLIEMQGGSRENLKNLLLQLLRMQQFPARSQSGYLAGNIINLLHQLGANLSHLNFAKSLVWQTDLSMLNLHEKHFSPVANQSISNTLCVAFDPEAKHFANYDGEVNGWNGRLLASGGEDLRRKIWDMQTGKCLKILEAQPGSLAFVFDPQTPAKIYFLAKGSSDRLIGLWDIQSGFLHIFAGYPQGVLALIFRPDWLVDTCCHPMICLWDVREESAIALWSEHNSSN